MNTCCVKFFSGWTSVSKVCPLHPLVHFDRRMRACTIFIQDGCVRATKAAKAALQEDADPTIRTRTGRHDILRQFDCGSAFCRGGIFGAAQGHCVLWGSISTMMVARRQRPLKIQRHEDNGRNIRYGMPYTIVVHHPLAFCFPGGPAWPNYFP